MPLATPSISNYKPFYVQKDGRIYELMRDFGLVTQRNPYPALPTPKTPYAVDYPDKDGVREYTDNISYQPIEFEMGFYIRAIDDALSPEKTVGVRWDWNYDEADYMQTYANFEMSNGSYGQFVLEFEGVESAEETRQAILESYDGDIPVSDFTVRVSDEEDGHYIITIETQRRCTVYVPSIEEGGEPGGETFNNLPKLSSDIVREKLDEFFALVRNGDLMTYDDYTGIGYRLVRFNGFKEDVFVRTDVQNRTRATFKAAFKANDPVTRMVIPPAKGVISPAIFGECWDDDEGGAKTATFKGGNPTAVDGTRFSVYFIYGWTVLSTVNYLNNKVVDNLPPMGISEGEHLFEYNQRTNRFIYIDKL